jgi:hypothetical protein
MTKRLIRLLSVVFLLLAISSSSPFAVGTTYATCGL